MMPADGSWRSEDGATLGRRVDAFTEVIITRGQGEARASIVASPKRLAVVERSWPRSVLFQCPCSCGDMLVLNVDRAAGPAWRLRMRAGRLSLLPSVWRTTGCRSHFILWDNRVWWCGLLDDEEEPAWPGEMDAELRAEWRRIRAEVRHREGR